MPDDGSRVELVGLDEAWADIRKWAIQLGPELEDRAGPFAEGVASRTRAAVPKKTGRLAGSIHPLDTAGGVGVVEGSGVPYAGWIEFGGSRGRPAVPEGRYLYPIAEAAESEWIAAAEAVAEQTVRSFPWSTQ